MANLKQMQLKLYMRLSVPDQNMVRVHYFLLTHVNIWLLLIIIIFDV